MSNYQVWAEMARRKVQFHNREKWDEIRLWGLFNWDSVRHLLDKGLLITHMTKENKTIWVRPSKEAWEQHIKPLIESHTLSELQAKAGW